MNTERSGMSLRDKIAAMPAREEWLGGQRTKYVQLDEVLGYFDTHLSRDAVVSDTQLDEWVARHALGGMCRTDLRAAYEDAQSFAARHAAVPDGYVLVPVDPTHAMLTDGLHTYETLFPVVPHGSERDAMREAYKAMLAQRDVG